MKDRARILCTNQIPFCEQADELIFLRRGVVLERGKLHLLCPRLKMTRLTRVSIPFAGLFHLPGTYASAIQGDSELSRLLVEFGKKGDEEDEDSGEETNGSGSGEETLAEVEQDESKLEAEDLAIKLKMQQSSALMRQAQLIPVQEQKLETLKELKRSTRPKEKREQGSVSWAVYKEYVEANGYLGVSSPILSVVEEAELISFVPLL